MCASFRKRQVLVEVDLGRKQRGLRSVSLITFPPLDGRSVHSSRSSIWSSRRLVGRGQAAGSGLPVERGQVWPVSSSPATTSSKEMRWRAVGEQGVVGAVQGAGGGEDVALDAGDLDQAVDRVAGEAQVVLQAHLGGVLDLADGAAQQLGGRRGGHGAGGADLALAAHFGPGDGGVVLDQVADQPGGGQGRRIACLAV